MTAWTAESLPPGLAALHDQPGGTSLIGLAGILNAYDAMRTAPTEWGEPETQWTWGVRRPGGTPTPRGEYWDEPGIDGERETRQHVAQMQDGNGYRKALLRREATAWQEAEQ